MKCNEWTSAMKWLLKLVLLKLHIPNEGTDNAYAKQEWTEWFTCEVSQSICTFSLNNLKW